MQRLVSWEQASLPLMISSLKSRLRQVAWRRLAPFGITPEQFQALRTLEDRPGLCHGELACTLGLDKPSATRVIQGLARKGLAQILPSPRDGRKLCLVLTEAGTALMARVQPFRQSVREGLERGLEPEEQARLRALLGKLMDNLDAMEGDAHVDR